MSFKLYSIGTRRARRNARWHESLKAAALSSIRRAEPGDEVVIIDEDYNPYTYIKDVCGALQKVA